MSGDGAVVLWKCPECGDFESYKFSHTHDRIRKVTAIETTYLPAASPKAQGVSEETKATVIEALLHAEWDENRIFGGSASGRYTSAIAELRALWPSARGEDGKGNG